MGTGFKRKLFINRLFGAVKLTKNADPDKYSYSRHIVGFDSVSLFLQLPSGWSKNFYYFWSRQMFIRRYC